MIYLQQEPDLFVNAKNLNKFELCYLWLKAYPEFQFWPKIEDISPKVLGSSSDFEAEQLSPFG